MLSAAFCEVMGIHHLSRVFPDIPVVNDPSLNAQLITVRQQSQQFRSRLEQIAARLGSRRATMQLKEQIAEDIKPLFESGAMSRNQYLLQLNQFRKHVPRFLLLKKNVRGLLVRLPLN